MDTIKVISSLVTALEVFDQISYASQNFHFSLQGSIALDLISKQHYVQTLFIVYFPQFSLYFLRFIKMFS
jgi:hypothetical protein